tara:strand:- start:2242 stop:2832 length:591 start_codon:yes stop_codon:yes gene_type:complete
MAEFKLTKKGKESLRRQASKKIKNPVTKQVQKKFNIIKKEMIKEFMSLPVTQEILQGPGGINISGTLDGVSNLFAFIGFDRGEQPVLPIIQALENTNIRYDKPLKKGKKIGAVYNITLPTAQQIFSITPLPWATGRSWAQGIEVGISGLGYLLRKNKGRSGAAIQSRVKVRGGRFKNTSYISAFIKKYRKRFEELK